jgi:hypothetical protein
VYEALGQSNDLLPTLERVAMDTEQRRSVILAKDREAARGYLSFYAVPGGDVVLEFDRHRSLEPVQQHLADFRGTIQTDAYEVYRALERREADITRVGCLAHARRHLYAAVRDGVPEAIWFIGQLRGLYGIEDEARAMTPADRSAFRQQHAPSIWEALKAKAEALQPLHPVDTPPVRDPSLSPSPIARVEAVLAETDHPLIFAELRQACRMRTAVVCQALAPLTTQGRVVKSGSRYQLRPTASPDAVPVTLYTPSETEMGNDGTIS